MSGRFLTPPWGYPTPLRWHRSAASAQMRMIVRVHTSIRSAESNGLMYRELTDGLPQVPMYILQLLEWSAACNYQEHSLRLWVWQVVSSRHWPNSLYITQFCPLSHNSLFYQFLHMPLYTPAQSHWTVPSGWNSGSVTLFCYVSSFSSLYRLFLPHMYD